VNSRNRLPPGDSFFLWELPGNFKWFSAYNCEWAPDGIKKLIDAPGRSHLLFGLEPRVVLRNQEVPGDLSFIDLCGKNLPFCHIHAGWVFSRPCS
jgi:hypothetical protein